MKPMGASTQANERQATPPTTAFARISCSAGFPRAESCARRHAAAYGVGVGTLRETLSRLSAEGLVLAEGSAASRCRRSPPPICASSRRCGCCSSGTPWRCPSPPGDVEWEGRVVAAHHKLEVVERLMLAGARRGAGLEALRRRVPPGADLGLRLAAR